MQPFSQRGKAQKNLRLTQGFLLWRERDHKLLGLVSRRCLLSKFHFMLPCTFVLRRLFWVFLWVAISLLTSAYNRSDRKRTFPVAAKIGLHPRPLVHDLLWWDTAASRQHFQPPGKPGYIFMYCLIFRIDRSARPLAPGWDGAENFGEIPRCFAHCSSVLLLKAGLLSDLNTLSFLNISLGSVELWICSHLVFEQCDSHYCVFINKDKTRLYLFYSFAFF